METKNDIPAIFAKSRKQWRRWLEKNHESKRSVYLIIYHKKSKTQGVSYTEAVEEALCFGWIDSKANKRDIERVIISISPPVTQKAGGVNPTGNG